MIKKQISQNHSKSLLRSELKSKLSLLVEKIKLGAKKFNDSNEYYLIALSLLALGIGLILFNNNSASYKKFSISSNPQTSVYFQDVVSSLTPNVLWFQTEPASHPITNSSMRFTVNAENVLFLNNVVTIQPDIVEKGNYYVAYYSTDYKDKDFDITKELGNGVDYPVHYHLHIKDGTIVSIIQDSLFLCSFIWAYLAIFKKEKASFIIIIGVPTISLSGILIILFATNPVKEIILQLLSS